MRSVRSNRNRKPMMKSTTEMPKRPIPISGEQEGTFVIV